MSIKIENRGYDEILHEKLMNLDESVKLLSSDNFEKISPALIELDKKVESINYRYAGNSMVNSVDTYKIDRMIDHLKMSSREFFLVEEPRPASLDGSDNFYDLIVPAGFTGLQSVVLPVGIMSRDPAFKTGTMKEFMIWYTKNDRTIRFEWKNIIKRYKNINPEMFVDEFVNYVAVLFWR